MSTDPLPEEARAAPRSRIGRRWLLPALVVVTVATAATVWLVQEDQVTADRAMAGVAVRPTPVPTPDPTTPTLETPSAPETLEVATVNLDTAGGVEIDSRDDWFDAQFSMTAGSESSGCPGVAPTAVRAGGRGNFTWTLEKKPYSLNFDDRIELCEMGRGKKWALLANHYDRSLLRTSAGLYLGSVLDNLAWTPDSVPVDLYINGAYQGSYTLIERVTIASGRVDIDELEDNQDGSNDNPPEVTGGYLLEWDHRLNKDYSVAAGGRGWVGIREPEDEDDGSGITAAQVNYVDQYLDQADAALFGEDFGDDAEGWMAYIDAAAAVDFYIAQEIVKTEDGHMNTSVLMYKERDHDPAAGDQGKLYLGPLWDMDTAMGNEAGRGDLEVTTGWYLRDRLDEVHKQSDSTWYNRLNEDPDFQALVRERWQEVYPGLLAVDEHIVEQEALIANSATRNFQVWDVTERLGDVQVVKGSWPDEVLYLRSWLHERIEWMNAQYTG